MKHGDKRTRKGQHHDGGWTKVSWAKYTAWADMVLSAILSPFAAQVGAAMNERED